MELKAFSEFKQEKYNLMNKICRCDSYEDIFDVLKLYIANKTMEQLKGKLEVEVIDGDLYVIEGGEKRKIISATKEILKELKKE